MEVATLLIAQSAITYFIVDSLRNGYGSKKHSAILRSKNLAGDKVFE